MMKLSLTMIEEIKTRRSVSKVTSHDLLLLIVTVLLEHP